MLAFLTTGAVANLAEGRGAGLLAIVAWIAAAVLIVLLDGYHWFAVFAFLLSTLQFGAFGFRFPTRIDWDFRSDDHSDSVR